MRTNLNLRAAAIGAIIVVAASGCGVSKKIVAQKDADLVSCARSLKNAEAEGFALKSEKTKLEDQITMLESQITMLEMQTAKLEKESDEKIAKVDSELKAQISAKSYLEADLRNVNLQFKQARDNLSECQAVREKEKEDAQARLAEETEALTARETSLRSRLESEISSRSVEIERLRDRLNVRMLDSILFNSGSAKILPEGMKTLDKVAEALLDSNEKIRVEGHTDNVPIREISREKYPSNWELSSARASSVIRYFQSAHAIAPERMEAVGLALYAPIDLNDTDEGRQRNRRVEIVLTNEPSRFLGTAAAP